MEPLRGNKLRLLSQEQPNTKMNQKYLGGRNMDNSVTGTGHHILGLQARDTGGRKWTEFLMDHDSHCREKPKANFKAGTKDSGLCF